jgi:hypothetical protein
MLAIRLENETFLSVLSGVATLVAAAALVVLGFRAGIRKRLAELEEPR